MARIENVLFIVIDALRADRVGVYNNTNLTPNIDSLAAEGEVFEQCYACINATDPSLTTILTGQYPTRHGLVNHGEKITQEERYCIAGTRNLAERINDSHTTIAVDHLGRWHQNGFTHYLQDWPDKPSQRGNLKEKLAKVVHQLPDKLEQRIHQIYNKVNYINKTKKPYIKGDIVTNTVLKTIQEADKPWFAFAHYWDTHIPYNSSNTAPDEIKEQSYENNNIPLREIFDTIEGSDWADSLRDLLGDAETVGDIKRQYDTAAFRVDEEIGRLIDYLKEVGAFEKTAIVITSDHGESLTEHGIFFDHHGLYDTSLHVPLIICAPQFDGRESGFVQHFDLTPTVLELLGKEHNQEEFDGISLVPKKSRCLNRDAIYAEEAHTARRRCIRTDSYKYIKRLDDRSDCIYCNISHSPGDELYNLENDPKELDNIVDKYEDTTRRLSKYLDYWVRDLPEPNKNEIDFEEDSEVMQRLSDMGYI